MSALAPGHLPSHQLSDEFRADHVKRPPVGAERRRWVEAAHRPVGRRPAAPRPPAPRLLGRLALARPVLLRARTMPSPPLAVASLLAALLAAPTSSAPPAPLPDPARLLAQLAAREPPVDRVQAAAAAVVEVAVPDPAALAGRRRLAALLPRLSAEVRAEQRSYRVVGLQGTSEVDYLRSSPGTTVRVQATWELADLWASRGEPSAASAALTRLRRREEAVERATALYFERRRLLLLLTLDPPAAPLARAELELALDRATAELDAMTGGLYRGRIGP